MTTHGKWFTCTPVRFKGDSGFFARDSGLLCKGFQELGIECMAIMPGPPMDGDQIADLIRTDYSNLESPKWWSALGAEGVVLYSWADPKFEQVASAIREAGICLVINTDTSGVLSVWTDGMLYVSFRFRYLRYLKGNVRGFFHFLLATARSSLPWAVDYPRLNHMRHANMIGAVTPMARHRMACYATRFGYPDVASRIQLIHHPVSTYTTYDKETKEDVIVALGRWTKRDLVKRPHLLLSIADKFLLSNERYRLEIIGPFDDILEQGLLKLSEAIRSRIILHGILPNADVAKILKRSKISLCTSSNESFHIASAEAVCAGCTVVGLRSPLIAFLQYLAEEGCASLAQTDHLDSYLHALKQEVEAWESNRRNPQAISQLWSSRLQAPTVAREILRLLQTSNT